MGWREKIADWISGGELSRLRDEAIHARSECSVIINGDEACVSRGSIAADYFRLIHSLNEIAAQETPGANATVKRMARIAREAMTWE